MLFTEDTFEQAIIELLQNLRYDHIYAPDMDRDYTSPTFMDYLQSAITVKIL